MSPLSRPLGNKISVLVASADRMGAQLIADDLKRSQRRFRLVDTANTSEEALRRIHEHKPDIALINGSLADGSSAGYTLLRELRGLQGNTKAIVMIPACERNLVVDAFREGARGVFCRDQSPKLLAKCIQTVHRGQIWAGNSEIEHIISVFTQLTPLRVLRPDSMPLLTKREAAVVCLLAEGMGNREISVKLNVKEHTIRNYLSKIYEKLGLSSRVELALYAVAKEDMKRLISPKT